MDVVELGLLYQVEVEGPKVKVIHSLTSMGCPAGPMIQEGIHDAAAAVPGVEDVEVELTWDPPWTPDLHVRGREVHPGFRLTAVGSFGHSQTDAGQSPDRGGIASDASVGFS